MVWNSKMVIEQAADLAVHLELGEGGRQRERAIQAGARGNFREQVLESLNPDGGQHGAVVVRGIRHVFHGAP
jgi:hypothetical protein